MHRKMRELSSPEFAKMIWKVGRPSQQLTVFGILILLTIVCVSTIAIANSARRALLVGIDNYASVPSLERAVADATSIAEKLTETGFEVTHVNDLSRRAMAEALARFLSTIEPGDTVLFFYAGHAVQIEGRNFLLLSDFPNTASTTRSLVRSEGFLLDQLFAEIKGKSPQLFISIIDACRNDPFGDGSGRALVSGRGLARIEPPEGSFVLFSARAGEIALDRLPGGDESRNSVFTRKLLPLLTEPGLELRDMAVRLKQEVSRLAATADHQQVPSYYDDMLGQFAFVAGSPDVAQPPAPAPVAALAPAAAPAKPPIVRQELERATASDEAAMNLSLDERLKVQSRLTRLGFNTKGIDGVFGQNTRSAIRAWQRANGKFASGFLSADHAVRLLESPTLPQATPTPAPVPGPGQAATQSVAPAAGSTTKPGNRPPVWRFEDQGGYIDDAGCARRKDGSLILCP